MEIDNDTRGWILCAFSGVACVLGAAITCIDYFVRLLPGKRNFRIQQSSAFLACSLSLSFGVMLFSALYSMLPSAMRYLTEDGWDHQSAGFLMMTCFVTGYFGIKMMSRVLHQYMPSHVVDCDHTHQGPVDVEVGHHHGQRDEHTYPRPSIAETTPLLSARTDGAANGAAKLKSPRTLSVTSKSNGHPQTNGHPHPDVHPHDADNTDRRPSARHSKSLVMCLLKDTPDCSEEGPCFGYSDPCNQSCFKHTGGPLTRSVTLPASFCSPSHDDVPRESFHENPAHSPDESTLAPDSEPGPIIHTPDVYSHSPDAHSHHSHHSSQQQQQQQQHHHHVPTNAFLSISLQTVLAIALHKFPEGFITYATNHANPTLGLNVFLALSVHNITEGFAMALPLYLALNSRVKAIAWAALLGGLSQPLGAGVAVLWFTLAGDKQVGVNNTAYGCLFAGTAGIMVSVALQLFVESLGLKHDREMSILFGFGGMMLMGVSNALVSH
ncbi:putative metal ion transmembrane transporter protein [Thermochaetoides thermophila DSM 1495]|uniref:Putative metal ion transmembrane transporter protein n=1 Tax=Chaetomium thermophilum (strain DSM 1495 / CBS 144.50 / IMI 039719) TaxID=759272 RepID=G0SHC0_CHATD|nr:putative metal ion transmembrane transporter protein [Thermochaetoides thermophila DSM 1495]EGS17609.1 putative metal ion transmembrane transporter protein [Thermochaetoides thermophila DSM 1495]